MMSAQAATESLRSAASIACYEESNVSAYRRELERSWDGVVVLAACRRSTSRRRRPDSRCCTASSTAAIRRIDADRLSEICFAAVPWHDLCSHYDTNWAKKKYCDQRDATDVLPQRRRQQQHLYPPLVEVLNVLLPTNNNCDRRRHCAASNVTSLAVIHALLRALIFRNPKRPSRSALLRSIDATARNVPALQAQLPDLLSALSSQISLARQRQFFENELLGVGGGGDICSSMDAVLLGPIRRVLSLAKRWIGSFPKRAPMFLNALLDLLLLLDGIAAFIDRKDLNDEEDSVASDAVSLGVATADGGCRRKRKRPCADLDYIHGEMSDEEERELLKKWPVSSWCGHSHGGPPTRPSWNAILRTSVRSMTNSTKLTRQTKAKLEPRIDILRANFFRVLVPLLESLNGSSCRQLDFLVNRLVLHTSSGPSTRFCALLCAIFASLHVGNSDCTNKTASMSILSLLRTLWSTASAEIPAETEVKGLRCMTTAATCPDMNINDILIFYADVVSECAIFDGPDLTPLRDATEPLTRYLRQVCHDMDAGRNDDDDENVVVDTISSHYCDRVHPFLYCFASILARRGVSTMIRVFPDDLHALFVQLSIHFGRAACWIVPERTCEFDRDRILRVLLSVGILGILDGRSAADAPTNVREEYSTPSLRSLAARLSPYLPLPDGMLSPDGPINATKACSAGVLASARSLTVVPLTEYVNEEVLRHVFSFLGYKRVTHLRSVCRDWKSAADCNSVWHQLYSSRFGLVEDDALAHDIFSSPWKKMFVDKWRAERAIRFQHHKKTFWRLRICPRVGCLHVLKTPKQAERHRAKHKNEANRKKHKKARRRG